MRREPGYQRFLAYVGECGLEPELRAVCLRHAVTLRDVYLDTRGPTVAAARLEVWWRLIHVFGKSQSEVARIFDRDSTTINSAMGRLEQHAGGVPIEESAVGEVARSYGSAMEDRQREAAIAARARFDRPPRRRGGAL